MAVTFDQATTEARINELATALVVGVVAASGVIIILAAPRNRVGWLLLAAAAIWGAADGMIEAGVRGVVTAPGSVFAAGYFAAVGPALRRSGWLLAVVGVPMIFPDGRLPGALWRWLGAGLLGSIFCLGAGEILSPEGKRLAWSTGTTPSVFRRPGRRVVALCRRWVSCWPSWQPAELSPASSCDGGAATL